MQIKYTAIAAHQQLLDARRASSGLTDSGSSVPVEQYAQWSDGGCSADHAPSAEQQQHSYVMYTDIICGHAVRGALPRGAIALSYRCRCGRAAARRLLRVSLPRKSYSVCASRCTMLRGSYCVGARRETHCALTHVSV